MKTAEPSSDSMIGKIVLLLLAATPLVAAPSMAVQDLKIGLSELSYKMHGQEVELNLLLERLNTLEKQQPAHSSPSDSRLANLEKAQKALSSDFQSLKKYIESTNSSLVKCQKKLSEIDGKLTGEIKSLKSSLHSMLALLQGEAEDLYAVKPGDSLGQIALDHKISTKSLKELNQLKNDTIIVGQKLKIR